MIDFNRMEHVAGVVVIAVAGVLVLAALARALLRRGPRNLDPDAGLAEDLAEYLPPPQPGAHRLAFEGLPARLRLVVLAPAGRLTEITPAMAKGLLQTIVHGLGEVADLDEPQVRVWPPQLSQEGFTSKFFANVARPESPREMSRWILVAGPARAGQKTALLGLALQTPEPTARGNVRMDLEKWNDKLRVKIVE